MWAAGRMSATRRPSEGSPRCSSSWTPSMSYAPSAALEARHSAIRAELARAGLDALVVTALPNILYLTNFSGSAAVGILTGERAILLTDSRYATVVAEARGTARECPTLDFQLVEGSYDAKLAAVLASGGWARVG